MPRRETVTRNGRNIGHVKEIVPGYVWYAVPDKSEYIEICDTRDDAIISVVKTDMAEDAPTEF